MKQKDAFWVWHSYTLISASLCTWSSFFFKFLPYKEPSFHEIHGKGACVDSCCLSDCSTSCKIKVAESPG